jgi:hypothetical protein
MFNLRLYCRARFLLPNNTFLFGLIVDLDEDFAVVADGEGSRTTIPLRGAGVRLTSVA